MAAELGSLQVNYICSLTVVESLLSIVIIFFSSVEEWYFKACIITRAQAIGRGHAS